jgi:hypothetical protein
MEGMRNTLKNFIGKAEGKRTLWRSRRKWEENITIYTYLFIRDIMSRYTY